MAQQINIWDSEVSINFMHDKEKGKPEFTTIPTEELEKLVNEWKKKQSVKSNGEKE